jgi:hypothetical protein
MGAHLAGGHLFSENFFGKLRGFSEFSELLENSELNEGKIN